MTLNDIHAELTVCSAFFRVAEDAAATRPGNDAVIASMKLAGKQTFDAAIEIAQRIGMRPEAMWARYQMSISDMMDNDMRRNWANYSIVLQKHGQRCVAVLNAVRQQ